VRAQGFGEISVELDSIDRLRRLVLTHVLQSEG
jgi:hypothetical protein